MTEPESSSGVHGARIPWSVTAIAITALVLASIGVLGACLGVLSMLTQSRAFDAMEEVGATSPDPAAMTRMLEPMVALQERIFFPTLAMQALLGLSAVAMGLVGILVLMRHPRIAAVGPALLFAAGGLAVLATLIELWIQHVSMDAMGGMMTGMGDPSAAAVAPEMARMMGIMRALSYGCIGSWLLFKLSFAVWAAMHLRSPEIAGLFGGPRVFGARGD